MKKIIVLTFLSIGITSCAQVLFDSQPVNKKPLTKTYKESRKVITGQLTSEEYSKTKNEIVKLLNVNIPDNQNIYLNYYQGASNCSNIDLSKKKQQTYYSNIVSHTNYISKKLNAASFFIYNSNSFHADYFKANKMYILDSGFFKDNIFKLSENCEASFILKPSGAFQINYGTDAAKPDIDFLQQQ